MKKRSSRGNEFLSWIPTLYSALNFFFQAEDGRRDYKVTGVQTCALPIFGEPPDDQIATETERRSGVIQLPPGAPQLLGRAIDQPGDFAINLGQVLVAKPVPSGVVCTETGERLARVLESRSIVDWRYHTLAGSAMR